jgi:hypothetical protein
MNRANLLKQADAAYPAGNRFSPTDGSKRTARSTFGTLRRFSIWGAQYEKA